MVWCAILVLFVCHLYFSQVVVRWICNRGLWICAGDGDVVVVRWRWLWVVDPGDIDDLSGDDVDGKVAIAFGVVSLVMS